MDDRVLSCRDVMSRMRCGYPKVIRWIQDGRLVNISDEGGMMRIPRWSLIKLQQDLAAEPEVKAAELTKGAYQ
jgi:hypothetical protein